MTESGRVIYTADAHVTGGRAEGHGHTSDGAYAACFESALGVVGRRRRQETGDVAIDSRVMLLPTEDRRWKLAVALAVDLPSLDDADEAVELVRAAHQVCPYSNAHARQHRCLAHRERSRRRGHTSPSQFALRRRNAGSSWRRDGRRSSRIGK